MSVQSLRKQDPISVEKPLYRTQQYLIELKVCIGLFRDVVIEAKDALIWIIMLISLALSAIANVMLILRH